MLRPWIYLINPFISVTEDSYRKAKDIGDYTLSALTAAAEDQPAEGLFNTLLAGFAPVVQQYGEAYAKWQSRQGVQKGQTRSLTDLLQQLSSEKIEEWELAIRNAYRKDTPQYISLLPANRKPFQRGSQQDRITAVKTLGMTIGTDVALQTLKTEVDNFYDALMKVNITQKGSKTQKNNLSDDVEMQRFALCTELYGVLASLMQHFKETPEAAGNFFLLEELRNREQTSFRREVDGGETALVFIRTLEDGEQIKITTGNTALQAALVENKNAAMPQTALTVQANTEEIIAPEALGEKGNRFLLVKNASTTEKGAYVIDIL